jgi:hypothetical protein
VCAGIPEGDDEMKNIGDWVKGLNPAGKFSNMN